MTRRWGTAIPADALSATGYEQDFADIARLVEGYRESDNVGRAHIVTEVTEIFERGPFPVTYYSSRGVGLEILKCQEAKVKYGASGEPGFVRANQSRVGIELCKFMFPNLHDTARSTEKKTLLEKFHNRTSLEKAVRFACIGKGKTPFRRNRDGDPLITPGWLYHALVGGGAAPSNFPPMAAKSIYERFTQPGDVVWDVSSGFGGRLLGALTSSNCLTYLGTDPAVETCQHLNTLGELIESVTGRVDSFRIYNTGSENFTERDQDVDFVFSSPPYFDVEDYARNADDHTQQSHVRYGTRARWVEGYVDSTVQNIYRALKPGGRCVINLADSSEDPLNLVDAWVRVSEKEGLRLERQDWFGIKARPKSQQMNTRNSDKAVRRVSGVKREPLLVFRKR